MSCSRSSQLSFEQYVLGVANATREQGGTASKPSARRFLPIADSWSFPKYPERTVILPLNADLVEALRKFVKDNEAYLDEPDCWLGTWVNPGTGRVYLDIATGCSDLDQARRTAIETSLRNGRKIVAIFNPKPNRTIYLWDGVGE